MAPGLNINNSKAFKELLSQLKICVSEKDYQGEFLNKFIHYQFQTYFRIIQLWALI